MVTTRSLLYLPRMEEAWVWAVKPDPGSLFPTRPSSPNPRRKARLETKHAMARSLNKVMLIGNVGADPEIRSTGSGLRVGKVSLATNRTFQDRSGQQQERTEWHRLTFFGRLAEIVEQYVTKGDRLYVEGRIEYSQSEDDQGNVRYYTDIVVGEMVMLGQGGPAGTGGGGGGFSGGGSRSGSGFGGGTSRSAPDISEPDDDLPF